MFQGGSHFFQLNQQDLSHLSNGSICATIEVSHFKTSPKILSGVDLGYVLLPVLAGVFRSEGSFSGLPKIAETAAKTKPVICWKSSFSDSK